MNRPRAKGTAFETEVVRYLQGHGHPYAERRALGGARDRGDVAGIPGVVIEAKACKEIDLGTWVKEAETEAANAGVTRWAVVAKRRRHGVDKSYAIVSLELLAELLR